MKNTSSDLNNYLYAVLERLDDPALTGDMLDEEIRKSGAVCEVSEQIIANNSLLLKAQMAKDNSIGGRLTLPKALEG